MTFGGVAISASLGPELLVAELPHGTCRSFPGNLQCHECSSQYQAVSQWVPQAAQAGDRATTAQDPTQLGLTSLGQIPNYPLGIAVYRTSGNRWSF
jgi:hypothetical protein